MAYLGIKETENVKDNGLYYFDVVSVRNEIASHFTNPLLYVDREKEKALNELGLEEKDIQDGIVLIRKYRYGFKEEPKCYLGIRGTPFDGVYEFEHMSARDKIAKKFVDTFKSTDLDAILKEFKIDKSEVKNGGFLYGKEVNDYIKAHKSEIDISVKEKNIVKNQEKEVDNKFKDMLNVILPDKDVIEVLMNDGTVYCITSRSIYYLRNGVLLSNFATLNSDNEVNIDETKILKLFEDGDIIGITPSRVEYRDGFAILYNCDDVDSPIVRINEDKSLNICHLYDKVIINTSAISSIVGKDTYTELVIDYKKITSNNNKYLYDYLRKSKDKYIK